MPKLTTRKTHERATALLAKIQECENECHAIGFAEAAHAVNAAKNKIGWNLAEFMEAARKAMKRKG